MLGNIALSTFVKRAVRKNVGGTVRQYHVTEVSACETIAVAVWQNATEWGTHRVCIGHDSQHTTLLVWGHYFRGPHGIVDAYKDYHRRIASES